MKKRIIFTFCIIICLLLISFGLVSCSKNTDNYEGYTKVIFELEGGKYQNSQLPIVFYYDFSEEDSHLIKELTEMSGEEFMRQGYELEGWYTQKSTLEDGSVKYSGKWDFSKDKVQVNEITLYARWNKIMKYSFDVCYRDDDGNINILGSYPVEAGECFDDYLKYASKRKGYTSKGTYKDIEGNTIDKTFAHPGGEENLAIQVFPDYIEGTFSLVSTASDLAKSKNSNIYLMCDIDFEGKEFGGFGDYKGIIEGNGYKIKNFKLSYSSGKDAMVKDDNIGEGNLLLISIFRSIKDSEIRNVSFENVMVDIGTGYSSVSQIIFSPLCIKLENSSIKNTSVSVVGVVTELPDGFSVIDDLIINSEKAYVLMPDGDSSSLDISLDVVVLSDADNENK